MLTLLGLAVGRRLVLLPEWTQMDLDVYRRGAAAVAGGKHIYELVPGQLPFTYPPFAAVLMLPLDVLSRTASIATMATLSIAACALICAITVSRLRFDRRTGVFLALGAISLQPFFSTFELGQINLILMAMVMVDCLVLPRRFRGLCVGIAAGIKIIPGIFVLYFILRRDWRAVAQSSAALAATILVSAIVLPHETLTYWTHLAGAAARTGDTLSSVNQSLPAVAARLMHDRYPSVAVLALVSLCGIAFAALAARKQLAGGHDLVAVVCIAFGGLLASPVSWSHHFVWAAPALVILFLEKRTVEAGVGAAIYYLAPWQNIPYGDGVELKYGPWELLLSSALPVAAMYWLATRLFERSPCISTSSGVNDQRAHPADDFAQRDPNPNSPAGARNEEQRPYETQTCVENRSDVKASPATHTA